jgi:hypothetical protein
MQELYAINDFYPIRVADTKLRDYIAYHVKHLQKCHENELYSSAFTHLHILYMVFIYFQLLRIAKENSREFQLCWIGFPQNEKDFLRDPDHPLSFKEVNEKSVFRFFRLVGFDDGLIGNISSPVTKRNKWLHATGEIYCETENKFECEVNDYIVRMNKIIVNQSSSLNSIYEEILSQFESDYIITDDDIVLYFSDFSRYELVKITQDRNDLIANFIKENY